MGACRRRRTPRKDRWGWAEYGAHCGSKQTSINKHERAERQMIDVMHERGAWIGSPMMRSELMEAAKQRTGGSSSHVDRLIADMDGKVVAAGGGDGDRRFKFRRRLNAKGTVECWLQPVVGVDAAPLGRCKRAEHMVVGVMTERRVIKDEEETLRSDEREVEDELMAVGVIGDAIKKKDTGDECKVIDLITESIESKVEEEEKDITLQSNVREVKDEPMGVDNINYAVWEEEDNKKMGNMSKVIDVAFEGARGTLQVDERDVIDVDEMQAEERDVIDVDETSDAVEEEDNKSNNKNNKKGKIKRLKVRGKKFKWSAEKHKWAEGELIAIMRELRPRIGTTITRKELEEVARKQIKHGTLVNHMLKHSVGNVMSHGGGGRHRFMRCINDEGLLVFWLEAPELEDRRRRAGVMSPCDCDLERALKWSKQYELKKPKLNQLIDIVRQMVAKVSTPIVKEELVEVASKHIDNTSHLDYMLKFADGKIVRDGQGKEWWFVSQRNTDGVLAYWLEPVGRELQNQRGDQMINSDSDCTKPAEVTSSLGYKDEEKVEVYELKEETGHHKRDSEEVRSLMQLEKRAWQENYDSMLQSNIQLEAELAKTHTQGLKENYEMLLQRTAKLERELSRFTNTSQGLKENCTKLLKRTIELEADMDRMNSSFQGLKNKILLLKEEKKKQVQKKVVEGDDANGHSDIGWRDKENENNQLNDDHISVSSKAFISSQLHQSFLQLPSQSRVCEPLSNQS